MCSDRTAGESTPAQTAGESTLARNAHALAGADDPALAAQMQRLGLSALHARFPDAVARAHARTRAGTALLEPLRSPTTEPAHRFVVPGPAGD